MNRIFLLLTLFTVSFTLHANSQMNTVADTVRHYENLMQTTDQPEEFERARSWLNRYYRDQVTRVEEDVPVYVLPDPLRLDRGHRVDNTETWVRQRRPEILEQFRTHVYGRVPEFDYDTSYQIQSVDEHALGGLATRKQVRVELANRSNGSDATIDLLIYLPNSVDGPVPVFMGLNFYGNHTIHKDEGIILSENWMRPNETIGIRNNRATEETRGYYTERWQVEDVLQRGYAVVTAYAGDVEPDEHGRMRQGVRALAYGETGKPAGDERSEERRVGKGGGWGWGRCV